MWFGGVRVIIPDEENRILLVCHHVEGKDIWLPPGGSIEEGETSQQAAVREVFEETGLTVSIRRLIWHVEEVSKRGQRFAVYFVGSIENGQLALGSDPEFSQEEQVLRDVGFFTREEVESLPHVYPPYLREEVWAVFEQEQEGTLPLSSVYKIREFWA